MGGKSHNRALLRHDETIDESGHHTTVYFQATNGRISRISRFIPVVVGDLKRLGNYNFFQTISRKA